MRKIKGTYLLCVCVLCTILCTACGDLKNTLNVSISGNGEKIHDDIEAGSIRQVNISGNARSIIIRQSVNDYFEFYNADLNADHKYEVSCDENDNVLHINVMMEDPEADQNILGSIVVYLPRKEFEIVETTGAFQQIHFDTINSDVLVHANDSSVVLQLAADQLDHNITLEGSESNAFRSVSVYLDKMPDNISMIFNIMQGGTIDVPQSLFQGNTLEAGSGKPVISIHNTKLISFYMEES